MSAVRSITMVGMPGPRAQRVAGVVRINADEGQRKLDRLYALLEDWARWCSTDHTRLGFAPRAAGLATGGIYTRLEDMEHTAEQQRLERVDTVVEDLSVGQREAIKRKYGLQGVFRFHHYEKLLQLAHESLLVALPRKGVDIV